MKNKYVFCGMMGAGKTFWAKKLGQKPLDLDELIEQKAQKSIVEIFQDHGEKYFRKEEREILLKSLQMDFDYLALGGGSLQDQEIIDAIKEVATLVYLKESEQKMFERIANSSRPKLTSFQEFQKLLKAREHYYQQADIIAEKFHENFLS